MKKILVPALIPGFSLALDVEGTCQCKKKGYRGTMTIPRMGSGFFFAIKTTSQSNGQM